MDETVKQGNVATEEKTFTQTELDAIVSERLKRDRAKYADYEALKEKAGKYDEMEAANKTELQKAVEQAAALQLELDVIKKANELREMRESVAKETGVPAALLTGDTEDECREQAAAIVAYARPNGYPNVRDAGETNRVTKGTPKQHFEEWAKQAFG